MDSHTVQKAYLKEFLLDTSNPRFFVFSKDNKCWRRKSPKSTTTHEDFYTFTWPDGTVDNSIEHRLNETVESPGIMAIRRLVRGDRLIEAEKRSVALYLGYMLTRTIKYAKLQEAANAILSHPENIIPHIEKMRHLYEQKYPANEIDGLIESLLAGKTQIKLPESWYLVSMRKSNELAALISSMNWVVETTTAPNWFITSDHPAFVCRPTKPYLPYAVGLSRDDLGAELCFPLSPTAFMRASFNQIGPRRMKATKLRVRELNRRVVIHAVDDVIAPDRTPEIEAIVAEEADKRVEPIDPRSVIP